MKPLLHNYSKGRYVMIPAAGIEGIESCCSLRYGNKTRKLGIMIAPCISQDKNVVLGQLKM